MPGVTDKFGLVVQNEAKQRLTVFPAPLIEDTAFSLLYILTSFVKDKVPIDM